MTYGQLKFRLTKAFPGVDADLIEGWITDCHQEILGLLPWSRLDVQAILPTVAPYSSGTVSITQGSASVTLSGGTFTPAMSGGSFRIAGDDESYQFTEAAATSGTLDRPYAGAGNAAAPYAIYRDVYPMPANCRFLDEDAFASFELGQLLRLPVEEFQAMLLNGFPPDSTSSSPFTGVPRIWSPYMDDGSTPPQLQVKFFPVPDKVYGIPYTYCAEVADPLITGTTMLPWLQPAALIEGTTAKIKRHLKDYPGAQAAKQAFGDAVQVMMSQESYRRGPTQVQLDGYYTRHRLNRGRW